MFPFTSVTAVRPRFSPDSTRLATFSLSFCPIPTVTAVNRASGRVDPFASVIVRRVTRFPPFRPFGHGFHRIGPFRNFSRRSYPFPTVTAVTRAGLCFFFSVSVRRATVFLRFGRLATVFAPSVRASTVFPTFRSLPP